MRCHLAPPVTEDSKSVPVRGCEPGFPLVATVVVIGSVGVIGIATVAAVALSDGGGEVEPAGFTTTVTW